MWTTKVIDSNGGFLLIIATFPDNQQKFFYFRSTPAKIRQVQIALDSNEGVDLDEYGQVVASGEGIPDANIRKEMAEKYDAMPH